MECVIGMESLPFPDEIMLKIFGYLSLGQLIQCARVSKRWNNICEDRSLSYRLSMLVMKKLNNLCKDCTLSYRSSMLDMKNLTVKDWKTIIDTLTDDFFETGGYGVPNKPRSFTPSWACSWHHQNSGLSRTWRSILSKIQTCPVVLLPE